jgi:hypothetical protein
MRKFFHIRRHTSSKSIARMSFLQPRPEETGPTSATVFTYDPIV